MARKKVTIERKPIKVKKTRKLSEEHKEKLRARLAKMRAKKKPAEYKNVAKSVLALPDEDKYSMKNIKEWIKESKDKVAAFSKTARSMRIPPLERQKAANAAELFSQADIDGGLVGGASLDAQEFSAICRAAE